VTPPEISSNELARCLVELESLILVRPATASIAEYLGALASDGVIDAETGTLVVATYNRLRYAGMSPAELEVRQASERLRVSIKALSALPDEERRSIAERIRQKFTAAASRAPLLPGINAAEPAEFAPRFDSRAISSTEDSFGEFAGGAQVSSNIADRPDLPAKEPTRRRAIRISSIPLETATLVLVGLVVAGYILRGGAEQALSPAASEPTGSKRAKVGAGDVWRNDDYWAANLRRRAETEAARKQERLARLGFELLIGEKPKDAGALNALAWLYLTSDDLSLRDPKRGLDLALRAIAISRVPAILDTAAEARFQTGRPDEAIKLEREALDSLPRLSGFQDKELESTLRRQFKKFQDAAISTSSQANDPPR
jgi:tetratricopeptide (TPR) repeat protein